ncbi:hypothetical protein AOLI_G00292930 [Acnodon oligacanthus]
MNHSAREGKCFLFRHRLSQIHRAGRYGRMMHWTRGCCWPALLWWGLKATLGLNATQGQQPTCQPGYYCPEGRDTALPCPRGMFGPSFWAVDVQGCISCPPHHYAPREGLAACLPCGSKAQQPLPGQDKCTCLGEGEVFQVSDGQCHCALGYRSTQRGDACELQVYEICKDGRTRDQYGECLDPRRWNQLCSLQFEGYDSSLGLCVCKNPPRTDAGRSECAGWCGGVPGPLLRLVCSVATLQLVYTETNRQVSTSGSALISVLKRWDSHGRLECDWRVGFSRPVYVVQTGEAGFYGLLHSIPAEVRMLILESGQATQSFAEASGTHSMVEVEFRGNHTHMDVDSHWSSASASRRVKNEGSAGVMNPTACLHLEDILLFTVTHQHYPQYDAENLFNTNTAFDWGPFRLLAQEIILARSAQSLFSISFHEPGVYALKLSSNQHKHMYVKVLPAGGECYDTGPFFPADPHHMTRMGIARRRQLLLQPDWLILFKEYGWPEKLPTQPRYRALQLKYNMDDYSSKGSRAVALKKTHRNLQVGMTEDSMQRAVALMSDEFWDYEEQVDLEAFSSSTFYDILLRHSVSITARLGQLRGEVKQLYQGVLGKMQGLHPGWGAVAGGKLEALERQVEQEMARRKALGTQLAQLLDSQLQILRAELRPQHTMHRAFAASLRECFRLLTLLSDNQATLWDKQIQQCVTERVAVLAEEMAELVSAEAQRQGGWAILKQATGAQLLCPASGTVLTRDDIIAPDGTVRASEAVHVDPCTGLIQPNSNTHMLLASGHSMPVPPDFFLHPQTGRVLPVAGNVSFDPASSTLVYTADACVGEVGKWESPLLPFIPYPPSCHAELPGPSKLKGLRAGQRLVLGGPMCDYDTGVLVPILAVTIHPQTGMVYPLGGVHTCPISRLRQPIQIGCPMMDPRTGSVALITGVGLDPHKGTVLPIGGLLLGESFIEPLSGRLVRVGGGSIRGGKVVPHAGGFQALVDSQALGARVRLVDQLRACCEECSAGTLELHNEMSRLRAAASDLEQAWKSSQHCMLQLFSRLEAQQEWAWGVAEDGGSVGEVKLPGTELSLPALPGLDYPDPGGSGLSVPVLGAQLDWVSGCMVPLIGTMEDADGKGLVPIRFGARTVDPVTGMLAPVVGARLDVWKRTIVPTTVSQCLTVGDTTDSVLVEALQKECSARGQFWRQQRLKEEELVADLERTLRNCLYTAIQEESDRLLWTDTERQVKEAAAELQEAAHTEAQRRSAQNSELSLTLPAHVLLTLTGGDEEEWEQQSHWHTELTTVLNRVSVWMARQQWEQDRATMAEEHPDEKMRQKELWDQLKQRHAELDAALSSVHWNRELSQLHADTAQAMLSGSFWYRDYFQMQPRGGRSPLKTATMTQRKILPQLERLILLLEDGKLPSPFASAQRQQSSDLSAKQTFDRDTCSRAWTVSIPVAKAASTHSLKDHEKTSAVSEQNNSKMPLSSTSTQRGQDSGQAESQDSQRLKEPGFPLHITVPRREGEDWTRLLELSPLFQLIKEVDQQIRTRAWKVGLLNGDQSGSGRPFIDFLDAQWECEGDLVQVSRDTLNAREVLIYQHGQLLLQLLHLHKVAPAVKLQLASSLPANDYHCNAFRNSFYYQEAEETLYVRHQRLQSVGGFSLLILHCAAHISIGQLSIDSTPAFQRAFFKVLQVCLSELFHARLGPDLSEERVQSGVGTNSALNSLLLERVQKPGQSQGILSEDDVARMLQKHRESSVFRQVESLLRDKNTEVSPSDSQLPIKHVKDSQSTAPE